MFEGFFLFFFFRSIQAPYARMQAHANTQSIGNEIMKSVQSRPKED